MGEFAEEKDMEDIHMEMLDRTPKSSPLISTPDGEGATTSKATTLSRSTRESTMTEESDGVKEVKTETLDLESKAMRGPQTTKVSRRTPLLFDNLPSATEEAINTFQVIQDSVYTIKHLGDSGQDEAMSCDCRSLWSEFLPLQN